MQKELLDGKGKIDWHFAQYVSPDDMANCDVNGSEKWMAGHIMAVPSSESVTLINVNFRHAIRILFRFSHLSTY